MKKKELRCLIILLVILGIVIASLYFFTNVFKPKEVEQVQEDDTSTPQKELTDDEQALVDIGYSIDEAQNIISKMSSTNLAKIKKHSYVSLVDYYDIKNFDFDKLDRYIAYQSGKDISMAEAVTLVNLNLDKAFYSEEVTVSDPANVNVLVNKYHVLPQDYVPSDLVSIPEFPHYQIRNVALQDFEALIAAAVNDGLHLIPFSTYRSYDYQSRLYQSYLAHDSQANVDTYSARPGSSEHQTGLAIDIRSSSLNSNLTDSDYSWMQSHSYLYGFIIRYTKNNQSITGYQEEPWHIRYLGVDLATKVHNSGLTYDEYYDYYLTRY